jgi:ligand-binding sensor domain-containing protein/putative methionine-R-sulfoxide reductase with GAF domain
LKKTRFLYYLCLLFIFACSSVRLFSQPPVSYTFEFYNSSHGLPSSEINALAKDEKGFLWLGTAAGLSRYDGYTFQNYFYAEGNELIGVVKKIIADKQKRLWIGSGAGLFCYHNNKIVKINTATAAPQSINDILPDSDGDLWLATGLGPVKINSRSIDVTGQKKIILQDHVISQWDDNFKKKHGNMAFRIAKANDGSVYISHFTDIFRLYENNLEWIHSDTVQNNNIISLFPVSKTKIYYDAEATEMNVVENGKAKRLWVNKLLPASSGNNKPGFWYIGTSGLYFFHPDLGVASQHINTIEKNIFIPNAFLKDDDFFWVASFDGLVKIMPSYFISPTLSVVTDHPDFYSFYQLKNGKLLAGNNRGIVLEEKEAGFSVFKKNLVSKAEIKAMFEDERGWLWTGSGYQGLTVVKQNSVENYTKQDGLHDNSLYAFLLTKAGKLYAIGDAGMTEIIVDKNNAISFKKFIYEPRISWHANFHSGIEAPDGTIWIAGQEGLIYLRNGSLQSFKLNNKLLPVNYIITDKNGIIWMATNSEGILKCRFNKNNEPELIQTFTPSDGLASTNYLTLLADHENNIWAGSSKGISLIGQTGKYTNRIINFDKTDGFTEPGYGYIRLFQDNKYRIWATTTAGITSFQPSELNFSAPAPTVYITGVKTKNNDWINTDYTKHYNFSYQNNSLLFNFTALDYAHQPGVNYFYQLSGLDTGWVASGVQRTVSYENLSPGNYTFRVKAIGTKGSHSKTDAVFTFTIKAPIWQKWWFKIAAVFLIGLGIMYLFRRRIKSIQEKEGRKTEIQKIEADSYLYKLEIAQVTNYFSATIHQQETMDELLWDVAKNLIGKLGFEDCMIYLWNEDKTLLLQKAGYGIKGSMQNDLNKEIYHVPKGKGIVGAAVENRHYILSNDTTLDKRYYSADGKVQLSELCVPIIHNNEAIGAINTEHSAKNFYTDRHLQILITIASMLADKIDMIAAQEQTRKKEMEVLKLNKDLATSQLTALRAQMNPHFIFNALNSVQQYILQGNITEANRYLSKFSKLQREVLNHSDQNFISLEKELEVLNLYLELEQLRFDGNFNYEIKIDSIIDDDEIKIPPMIVQPFVENAIWHGLMPKQGERWVHIHFTLNNEDILVCTVTDNGIGREAAARLKQNGHTQHKSKGLSLVYDRLNILQQQYGRAFEVTIKDLFENNVPSGTEVKLHIYTG